MKIKNKFLVKFDGKKGIVPTYSDPEEVVVELDGKNLFRTDRRSVGGMQTGYLTLKEVKPGKRLTVTFKSGQLTGTVLEVHEGKWMMFEGTLRRMDEGPFIVVHLDGEWMGSPKTFFHNWTLGACVRFEPLEGEIVQQFERVQMQTYKEFSRDDISLEDVIYSDGE